MAYGRSKSRGSGPHAKVTGYKIGGHRKNGPGLKLHSDTSAMTKRMASHKSAPKMSRKAL